jgi:hypothetical protein
MGLRLLLCASYDQATGVGSAKLDLLRASLLLGKLKRHPVTLLLYYWEVGLIVSDSYEPTSGVNTSNEPINPCRRLNPSGHNAKTNRMILKAPGRGAPLRSSLLNRGCRPNPWR